MPEREAPLESELQAVVADWCRWRLPDDVLWFSVPNEHVHRRTVDKLLATGMRPGAADLVFGTRGRALFVELKAPGGRRRGRKVYPGTQSDKQVAFEELAARAGFPYALCRSLEEVRAALGEHLGLEVR